jgi:hypothetical protein
LWLPDDGDRASAQWRGSSNDFVVGGHLVTQYNEAGDLRYYAW